MSGTIDDIFITFSKNNPDPKIELRYKNGYCLLVAIILSAQATDVGVNKVTDKLFVVCDDPYKMIEMCIEKLSEYVRSIGLWRNKSKNIMEMSKVIIEKYNGNIPDDFDLLIQLPGVGRKSANVFLNSMYHRPFIGVDTHVFRVSRRLGIADGKNPEETEKILMKKIPEHWRMKAHHWLVLHGRYVCKAKNPNCNGCIVNNLCLHNKCSKERLSL